MNESVNYKEYLKNLGFLYDSSLADTYENLAQMVLRDINVLKDNTIDFKTLNDSIDKEYENIFGKSLESDEDKSSTTLRENFPYFKQRENIFRRKNRLGFRKIFRNFV